MSLKCVDLLNLTSIGQTNILDAEIGFRIVLVGRYLSFRSQLLEERVQSDLCLPQYCEMALRSVSRVVFCAITATGVRRAIVETRIVDRRQDQSSESVNVKVEKTQDKDGAVL